MRKRLALLIAVFALAGCEQAMQDMYDQPKHRPLERSALFDDGRSARTPPSGTVAAREGVLADTSSGRLGDAPPSETVPPVIPILAPDTKRPFPLKDIPLAIDEALLMRGRERFDIYCAPCHGFTGAGDGIVVQRGFPAPPTYHSERLRHAPSDHFFRVITHGYGAMYAYGDRVRAHDRWAIVAYIRALQISQHAALADLPPGQRDALEAGPPP